jgi:hypothetical protein
VNEQRNAVCSDSSKPVASCGVEASGKVGNGSFGGASLLCVGFRFRGFRDIDGNDPWIYSTGDSAPEASAASFAQQFSFATVEKLYVLAAPSEPAFPADTNVTRCTGGPAEIACFRVTLSGKEYTRHGDDYTRWFEARHPRTGATYRKARTETSQQKRALIDAAIARFGGAQ